MPGASSIFVPIVVILAIILLAIVERAERAARARPAKRYELVKNDTPVCGCCGHPAMLDETNRCPECGETYAHAGVYTKALAIRLGPPFAITVITSIVGAVVLGFFLMMLVLLLTTAFVAPSRSNFGVGYAAFIAAVVPLVYTIFGLVRKARERRRLLAMGTDENP